MRMSEYEYPSAFSLLGPTIELLRCRIEIVDWPATRTKILPNANADLAIRRCVSRHNGIGPVLESWRAQRKCHSNRSAQRPVSALCQFAQQKHSFFSALRHRRLHLWKSTKGPHMMPSESLDARGISPACNLGNIASRIIGRLRLLPPKERSNEASASAVDHRRALRYGTSRTAGCAFKEGNGAAAFRDRHFLMSSFRSLFLVVFGHFFSATPLSRAP
jgi:hypothetical protein